MVQQVQEVTTGGAGIKQVLSGATGKVMVNSAAGAGIRQVQVVTTPAEGVQTVQISG